MDIHFVIPGLLERSQDGYFINSELISGFEQAYKVIKFF